MTILSLSLAGAAVAVVPVDETGPAKNHGQEQTPALVSVGPDPVYSADFYKPFQPQSDHGEISLGQTRWIKRSRKVLPQKNGSVASAYSE